jgi:hypothetical protein
MLPLICDIKIWAAYSPGCTESTSKCQLAMAMVAHAYEVPVLPVGPPEMNGDPEQEQKAKEMNMGTESTTATISQQFQRRRGPGTDKMRSAGYSTSVRGQRQQSARHGGKTREECQRRTPRDLHGPFQHLEEVAASVRSEGVGDSRRRLVATPRLKSPRQIDVGHQA